jgi:hypothetical protein
LLGVVGSIAKPESGSQAAILVIYNPRVGAAVHVDVFGRANGVAAVGRDGHILDPVVLSPDNNVLPVVPVAAADLGGLVLLEVVPIHVRAPTAVAARARVDVRPIKVLLVAAAAGDAGNGLDVQAAIELTAGADGRDVVAAVLVKVEGCV